jgi:hypothetical protein
VSSKLEYYPFNRLVEEIKQKCAVILEAEEVYLNTG